MKTGQAWTAANKKTLPEQEYLDQFKQFTELQVAVEQSAREFFEQLGTTDVPRAVEQAIGLNRTTVGFYASSWHLSTAAFGEFRQWLQGEGLTCMSAQLAADQREQADQDIVINVFPSATPTVLTDF